MSYVDDGTIIARSRKVEDNLPLLKEAYGYIQVAFTALGLILEHDKSEAFTSPVHSGSQTRLSIWDMHHILVQPLSGPRLPGGTLGSSLIGSSCSRSMSGFTPLRHSPR